MAQNPIKTIGYIRVSMDTQDLEKQRHLLLEHAQQNRLIIDEFIEAEVSSRKTPEERKINLLLSRLNAGDQLLVAELSRLGRNMLETLNIINALSEQGIKITFVRQPELSTSGSHAKLLLAIYRTFVSSFLQKLELTRSALKKLPERYLTRKSAFFVQKH